MPEEYCEAFARSAAANDWPGYRDPGQNHDRAFRIGLPSWALYQLQDREDAGEFRPGDLPDPKLLRAAEQVDIRRNDLVCRIAAENDF